MVEFKEKLVGFAWNNFPVCPGLDPKAIPFYIIEVCCKTGLDFYCLASSLVLQLVSNRESATNKFIVALKKESG